MTPITATSADTCPVVSFAVDTLSEARAGSATRILESRRFGRLELFSDQVLTFSSGLLGFEELREFCVVAPEALQPLTFLVSCDDPGVAFPVLPARMCLAEYAPPIPPDAREAVEAKPGQPLEILAICAVAQDTLTLHANLRGPVLINPVRRLGFQVVLHDSPYSLRHLLGAD
jgi:flagellar assembly factor FliW